MNAHSILLFAGLAGAAAAADLTLVDFRAEVQFRDRRQSKVAATVRLKGETGGAIVRHTFLIYDGRQIEAGVVAGVREAQRHVIEAVVPHSWADCGATE